MIRVVCGLGNPGSQYRSTRHNLGFEVIDLLTRRFEVGEAKSEDNYDYYCVFSGGRQIYLVKPTTFINRCGLAIKDALLFFEVAPHELFVISDDFNLPLGRLRIRKTGTSGGHKGLQSIIDAIGTPEFARLRLGVGPLSNEAQRYRDLITEFVLHRFNESELEIVERMESLAVEATLMAVNESLDLAINIFNSPNPAPGD